MNVLPLVARELRVAARRWGTYQWRLGAALLAFLVFGLGQIAGFFAGSPATAGCVVFERLAGLLLLVCLFEGARANCDQLSAERREGTLGLLLVTGVRQFELVLGKAVAGSALTLYGVLAATPILGLAVIQGGLTASEFARTVLALGNALFFATALGLAVSSFGTQARSRLRWALTLLALVSLLPWAARGVGRWWVNATLLPWVATPSPVFAFSFSNAAAYGQGSALYWGSLLLVHAVGWGLLGFTAMVLRRRSVQEQAPQTMAPRLGRSVRSQSEASRREAALRRDRDPVGWWLSRGQEGSWRIWALASASSVAGAGALHWFLEFELQGIAIVARMAAFLFGVGLKIGVAMHVSHALADPERRRQLGMLLGTPLSDTEIVRGHQGALIRAWRGPVMLWMTLEVMASLVYAGGLAQVLGLGPALTTIGSVALFGLLTPLTDLLAIGWMGSWFALRSRTPNAAAIKTLLVVQFVPAILSCGFRVIPNVLFWGWARRRVTSSFRQLLRASSWAS